MINYGLITKIVDLIVVSPAKYEDAKKRYTSISNWLSRPESSIVLDNPDIYVHGSFLLGTAINPINGKEFDLDIMCCLKNLSSNTISQADLKQKVGNEVVSYAQKYGMKPPEDKTRAWTINYSETSQFHIDILPAIPCGIGDSVYIPYKDNEFYKIIISPWEKSSNPKGYFEWFRSLTEKNYKQKLEKFANENRMNVEDVPKYTIRSVLQEVVMLLKRHRDIFFNNLTTNSISDERIKNEKVSSIIITTLAGMAYKQEKETADAFFNIVDTIEDNILIENADELIHFKLSEDFQIDNRNFKIVNPSNPNENFTDKWKENPYKKMAFFTWLKQLKLDVENLKKLVYGFSSKVGIVCKMFGENIKKGFTNFLVEDLNKNENLYIENIPYAKHITSEVSINGYASDSEIEKKDTYLLYQYKIESGQALPKNKHLLFIAKTTLGKPYKVLWQVANKEYDSIEKDQIRGELSESKSFHKNSTFRYQKVEETQYVGTHWVKCFIVKNEVVVAESKKFFVKVV